MQNIFRKIRQLGKEYGPQNPKPSYGKHTKEQVFLFKKQDGGFVKAFKNIQVHGKFFVGTFPFCYKTRRGIPRQRNSNHRRAGHIKAQAGAFGEQQAQKRTGQNGNVTPRLHKAVGVNQLFPAYYLRYYRIFYRVKENPLHTEDKNHSD